VGAACRSASPWISWIPSKSSGHYPCARCVRIPKRRILSRISSAVFLHLERLPFALARVDVRRIASRSCGILVCDPRLSAFAVSNPKNRATRFGHNAYVGMK
jgi:hypothetical protein